MSLRKVALAGMIWTFAQQMSSQSINFIISVVLARILMPAEFGIIGMIAVFVAIGTSLVNSGMTQSLIRTENPDQDDYSTVFFFNLGVSILIYGILFLTAPLIAEFYSQPILTNVLRVYCLSFIFDALSAVQMARLTKAMNFKKQMQIALPSLLVGGTLGIALAYSGFGVWSLVFMSICKSILNSAQLWFHTGWRPSIIFRKAKFRQHFGFGYKLTLSGLLNTVFSNSYQIVIGRFFSPAQVGFYTRASLLKQLPVDNISAALSKVTYPLFASIQNDDARLKRVYKQLMQMVIFAVAPVLLLMGVLAEPMFRFLFTEKWLPAVPYFQILCFNGILYPIHSYNLNVLKVKGRTDLFLRLEIVKKITLVLILSITIPMGLIAMIWGQVVSSVIAFFINTHYSGTFMKYPATQQAMDLIPIVLIAAMASGATWTLDYFILENSSDLIRLIAGVAFGGSFYLGTNYLLKTPTMNHYLSILKRKQ